MRPGERRAVSRLLLQSTRKLPIPIAGRELNTLSGAGQSRVDVPAMTNVKNQYRAGRVVYLVDDAIVAEPDSPTVATDQFAAAGRARVRGEGADCVTDSLECGRGNQTEFLLRSAQDGHRVAHARSRLSSSIALSNGTASSRTATAVS